LFDLPAGSRFTVAVGGEQRTFGHPSAGLAIAGSPIRRAELEADPREPLIIHVLAGAPRFYGAILEGTEPGVVLDAIGIDGARVATALAWDAPSFEAELAERDPELIVLAYGTNEAFDAVRVDRYELELERLLARFRRGAPNADCVILGPPDALARDGSPVRRVPEISVAYASVARRSGCAFISQLALMGGFGSFSTWANLRPPLAFSDGLHLTRRGYQRLGELVVGALFDGIESAPLSSRSR
jgi:lysophospholipase L1-like esterase